MKIIIGIPTYNDFKRVRLLLSSIYNYTYEDDLMEVQTVVIDDGTPDKNIVKRLKEVCDDYFTHLIINEHNEGIPKCWNKLTKYFKNPDIIILFNDDIQICHSNWLSCIKYFLCHNQNVGTVSFPTVQMDPYTGINKENYSIPRIQGWVKHIWSPSGQGFAFKKNVYDLTDGFWEDLVSFYEETDFGYQLAFKGYMSYMLPWPVIQHWGSQTFASNPELAYTIPNKLLMETYRTLLKDKFPPEKIEPQPGKVYRMEYSRVLFAQKWGCMDIWDKPQNEVIDRFKKTYVPREIKWINSMFHECSILI